MDASIENLAFCRLACVARMQGGRSSKQLLDPSGARVLVVDPSPVLRVGVTHMLHGLSCHRVVGCCDGETEALQFARKLKPDIVLTEVVLAQGTGLGLMRSLRDEGHAASVVFFSSFDERLFGVPIARAGASGFVNKSDAGPRVAQAVAQAYAGELAFSEQVRQQLLTLRRGSALRSRKALPGGLSPREFDVFRLMGKGLDTEEIAGQLRISPKTVGLHRFNINHKLGCRSSAELYRAAVLWSEAILVRDGADVLTRAFLQETPNPEPEPDLPPGRPAEA